MSGFTVNLENAQPAPISGRPRLPIYLLLDVSKSMDGAPIEALRQGLETFKRQIEADEAAKQDCAVAIITFSSDADLVTDGLIPFDDFEPPALVADGVTRLDRAFACLRDSMDEHVTKPVIGGHRGDYKPMVFLLTDGRPTDENGRESNQLWPDARAAVVQRPSGEVKPSAIVAVGCGPNVDGETLNEIAFILPTETNPHPKPPAFVMGRDQEDFVGFFQWLYITMRNTARAGGTPTLAQQAGSMLTTGDTGPIGQPRGSQPDL